MKKLVLLISITSSLSAIAQEGTAKRIICEASCFNVSKDIHIDPVSGENAVDLFIILSTACRKAAERDQANYRLYRKASLVPASVHNSCFFENDLPKR